MKVRALIVGIAVLIICVPMFTGCSENTPETGTLKFYANGEDFVRHGFVSKDGWSISFDHVYITLADITAYQTDPPYEPHTGDEIDGEVKVGLDDIYTLDLAEGGENAPPLLVGELPDIAAGHYNALSWEMVKAVSGPAEGHSLVMIGTAHKDDRVVDFTISIDEECEYNCGEYVGDERKGIVTDGGIADLEMTFHFDHIFGDAETPLNDELNLGAIGFEPFSDTSTGGQVEIDMADLHLGHVGEGHCYCLCD